MNIFQPIVILIAAVVFVFLQSASPGPLRWFGTPVNLLPALMVCTSLRCGMGMVVTVAVVAGLGFDSLSMNPLGVSVAPLFCVGLLINLRRELILQDQPFAQLVLGLAASALVPLATVLLLLSLGRPLLLNLGSCWQWLVMSAGGMLATPVLFAGFGWLNRALGYQPVVETSFRPDREIRRGRN